ncbi:MAG TPA: DinB family protein [Pseudonocardiaceae bacterium]|nr:DinB family protein [Pseudonocardiaceae bacterium]
MTETDRTPPGVAPERELLDSWLDYYRATIVAKCAGLTPGQLVERSCPPSPMSLIGLVRHLVEMERVYAHRLAEPGLPELYCTDADPEGDFDVTPATVADDLRIHAEHCARSREIMTALPLDDRVRWRYLYLAKEYARHCGHADLLRERIDGQAGE